jgi:serine phosphatase RsbU (regulator of sigma subunit)
LASGRYAEAVESYANIENDIHRRMAKPTLDIIQQYVFPKYRANAYAGYRDSTIAIGLRILDALDSAIVWQKMDDAAELATIYETQEKDHQIAEQEASLMQQRIVGLIVAIILLTVFFIVYSLLRRRAANLKAAKDRIESELRIARDIQMSMVPSTFPERDGLDMYASMTPAKEVGGDLYGYVLIGDKLYFAVGDVSGKGVPASLFMAQATRLFRTMATQGLMPAEICTHMNNELSGDDNVNGMFVTMFLGMLDLNSGHLYYCNAGHNPPVIGGGENQGEFLEMIANAPIGLFTGLDYEGEEIESVKGRALFIYTDGLNEAEDSEQNQFGDEKLLKILRDTHFDTARQVVETLYAEVQTHRNGAEPNDDLTMMCLRVS